MRSYIKMCLVMLIAAASVIAGVNIAVSQDSNDSREYRVEVNRLSSLIEKGQEADTARCRYVTNVKKLTAANDERSFNDDQGSFAVRKIKGEIYRFDYTQNTNGSNKILLNISLGLMALCMIILMLFIGRKIIKPFESLGNMPYELAKGNLTAPLKESKGKFFGKFLWGMDMLRERLEEQKNAELRLAGDKKTLVLSISHDIKTPLCVIELYAKALERNLYKDGEKQREVASSIAEKCNEIRDYVSDIIKSQSEDIVSLEVNEGEFYLSEVAEAIGGLYNDKLNLLDIAFSIDKYNNCILKGDPDRSVEVVQNVIENAVKYGDGGEINISFESEEDCILLTVKNSGCTLDERELPHIFDSFWRGSNADKCSGSGLGLYICRQIMHRMDGDIFAEIKDGFMAVTVVFRMAY